MYFSQNKQDKFLEESVFKGFKGGIFMDVGAHDGISINNTLFFEKNRDWTGVNIEPLPHIYEKLITNRPQCINLNFAVSDTNGTAEFIYNTGYTEMLSGLKNNYDHRHTKRLEMELQKMGGNSQIIQIETKRLDTICKENNINHIHLLSIDVEGAEFSVIKSIDFESVFIDVIVFENNYSDVSDPIIHYLQTKNYIIFRKLEDIYMIHINSQFYQNS